MMQSELILPGCGIGALIAHEENKACLRQASSQAQMKLDLGLIEASRSGHAGLVDALLKREDLECA